MRKNVLNSPRLLELRKKRLRIFINKIILLFIVFILIFGGSIYISRIKELNIDEIEIKGNKVENKEKLEDFVKGKISGNYLWLFPKTNIFLYPKNSIKDDIISEFSRVKNVDIFTENKKLILSINERTALYTWCGETFNLEAEKSADDSISHVEKCYFVNESGYIFAPSPYFSGEVYFKFYGPVSFKGETPIGSYFLPDIFEKLILFKENLSKIGLKPVILYKDKNEYIKILLSKANTSSIWPEIIFKSDSDLEVIIENLQTALATEPLQTEFKNKYSSLLYIDLRFGNKVYYKFR